jgi:hypothetical protein
MCNTQKILCYSNCNIQHTQKPKNIHMYTNATVTTDWKKYCDIWIKSMIANVCQYQVDGLPHDVHGCCGGQVGQS